MTWMHSLMMMTAWWWFQRHKLGEKWAKCFRVSFLLKKCLVFMPRISSEINAGENVCTHFAEKKILDEQQKQVSQVFFAKHSRSRVSRETAWNSHQETSSVIINTMIIIISNFISNGSHSLILSWQESCQQQPNTWFTSWSRWYFWFVAEGTRTFLIHNRFVKRWETDRREQILSLKNAL